MKPSPNHTPPILVVGKTPAGQVVASERVWTNGEAMARQREWEGSGLVVEVMRA
jgi:hypothetical protein